MAGAAAAPQPLVQRQRAGGATTTRPAGGSLVIAATAIAVGVIRLRENIRAVQQPPTSGCHALQGVVESQASKITHPRAGVATRDAEYAQIILRMRMSASAAKKASFQ